jgi:small subunit ribosomal protein S1
VQLSKRKADRMLSWQRIMDTTKEGDVVEGMVTKKIKGGLLVDIGVPVFLPASQVDVRRPGEIGDYIGKRIRASILKIDLERRNIVISRRKLIEEERDSAKRRLMETLKEGDIINGTVKNIADFGAFVDLGGIDGLLHITDMSWGRINHPSEVLNVGDEIKVQVLKFDRESERVSLGYKQLKADPWTTATLKYPVGARVKGKVVSLTDYGAFVELEEGVEGLIHVSEMSWSKKVKHPSKVLTVAQEVECVVLGIDQEAHRISLGLKQIESNPWSQLVEKYPVGSKIRGKVRNLTEFGAFVEVEEGIDGLIHISDLSWTKRVKHPSEVLKKGDTVEAIVLNIDAENQRLSLGLKQLATDMWDEFFAHHKVGEIVEGKIVRMTNFGAFVELHEGIEGLVHVSELDEKRVEKPDEAFKIGETYPMKIIKINQEEKKIGLSIRAVKTDEVQKDVEAYKEQAVAPAAAERSTTTMGDAFRALARKREETDEDE